MEALPQVSGTIIPLASPRGTEKQCELCQRVARLQCAGHFFTGNDAAHQQADWVGIHKKICHLLVPICTQTFRGLQMAGGAPILFFYSSGMQRTNRLTGWGSTREFVSCLFAGWCLRCSVDVYGPNTVQLRPTWVRNILGNLTLVAELLSQAEWSVLKSPDCGHAVHHRLHRSLGRLHMATGNLEQALLHFANDIYFASEEYSLDSIVTCGGYFLMADAFVEQGKMPIARSVYSEVCLFVCFQDYQSDKAQLVKVDEMLRTMLEFEQKDPAQIARVAHCLAMLWFLAGDSRKALGFGSTALQASQLIPNHDLTEPIQSLLQLVQSLQTDSHPGSD
uniref:Zinc finger MYND-type containing 12 n=1 Tax=Stegastes partitus TaxID=144197 RepID=A0A3B5A0H2_9TELE